MRDESGPLNRIWSLKRQTARLTDATCLAAKRKWEQLEHDVQRINRRMEELNRQFLDTSPMTQSVGSLRAFHDAAGLLTDQRRQTVAEAQQARRSFQEAARKCMHLHREVETLGRVLAAKREQVLREIDRREMEQLDEMTLQRQHRQQATLVGP